MHAGGLSTHLEGVAAVVGIVDDDDDDVEVDGDDDDDDVVVDYDDYAYGWLEAEVALLLRGETEAIHLGPILHHIL